MTIILMSSKELKRLEVIRQLDEGRFVRNHASELLGLSVKPVGRLRRPQ